METKKIVSVSDYLADHLRTEIITGSLEPGEKIKEYQLAEDLEVSRSILREVLRTLESERLVDTIPRKGSYVSRISLADFIELYEIREMIECKAVDLLMKKKIDAIPLIYQAVENESKLKVPSQHALPKEFLEFFETGLSFHSSLISSAGNNRLSQYFKSIQYNLLRYHVLQGSENLEAKTKVDHKEMVASLEKRRYGEAKKYLQDHIKTHAEIIIKNIEFKEEKNN